MKAHYGLLLSGVLLLAAAGLVMGTPSVTALSGGCFGDQCEARWGCTAYEDNCPGPESGCSGRTYVTFNPNNPDYACAGKMTEDICWLNWNSKEECVLTYNCYWNGDVCRPGSTVLDATYAWTHCVIREGGPPPGW